MSLTAVHPNVPLLKSSWHSSVVTLPAERRAATPFHSREWAAAWQTVRTEHIRGRHHLFLQDGQRQQRMSLYQVSDSPLGRAMEGTADVARPTFDADVLYGPSVYGEYGGLPGATVPVLTEAVGRGRALAHDLGTEALVIANIPSSKTGREFRRQHRRGTDAGLTLKIARGPELLPYLPEFTTQARTASERPAPALYGTDMLPPLTRVPGAVGLLAEHRDGTLAGGFFCFRYGSALYLWTAAIDQTRKNNLHTYGWLMYESVRFAAATGASVLDAGRRNYAYRARLGMLPIALTSVVYLTRPNPYLISRLGALHTGLNRHVLRAWNTA